MTTDDLNDAVSLTTDFARVVKRVAVLEHELSEERTGTRYLASRLEAAEARIANLEGEVRSLQYWNNVDGETR